MALYVQEAIDIFYIYERLHKNDPDDGGAGGAGGGEYNDGIIKGRKANYSFDNVLEQALVEFNVGYYSFKHYPENGYEVSDGVRLLIDKCREKMWSINSFFAQFSRKNSRLYWRNISEDRLLVPVLGGNDVTLEPDFYDSYDPADLWWTKGFEIMKNVAYVDDNVTRVVNDEETKHKTELLEQHGM